MCPKPALVRLAADGDIVVADPAGARPGRGAYVCGRTCAERAVARRAFPRAFRRAVSFPCHLLESID